VIPYRVTVFPSVVDRYVCGSPSYRGLVDRFIQVSLRLISSYECRPQVSLLVGLSKHTLQSGFDPGLRSHLLRFYGRSFTWSLFLFLKARVAEVISAFYELSGLCERDLSSISPSVTISFILAVFRDPCPFF